jgi:hypothetical protein
MREMLAFENGGGAKPTSGKEVALYNPSNDILD